MSQVKNSSRRTGANRRKRSTASAAKASAATVAANLVEVAVRTTVVRALPKSLAKRAITIELRRVLEVMGCREVEVSLLLTDDSEMTALNTRYRNKAKTTDVLSFPLQRFRAPQGVGTKAKGALGDLVISVPQAKRQARSYGTTFREELLRLLIHGTLHLLGHDHEGVVPNRAAAMRRLERKLRGELLA